MKKIFVKDITESSDICDHFLVKQKDTHKSKNGKAYLALKLCDSTGEIEGRVWDNTERISSLFERGDVIRITRGQASTYQKRVQVSVQSLEKADAGSFDIADFLESSEFPIDQMLDELKGYIKRIKNKHLKKLLELFFADKGFSEEFCVSTAAKALHHAYVGGLLEHTLSVTRLITLIQSNYPEVNADLLIAGAVLHDIGKTKELGQGVGFDYTNSGRLLGHIVMGITMLDKKIEQIDGFPKGLADHLKHMILSHHGQYEWGSPKKPKTVESMMLHYADDLDAKVSMFKRAVNRDVPQNESGWTGYNSLFERYLFHDTFEYAHESDDSVPPAKKVNEDKTGNPEKATTSQFSMFED